MTSKCQVIPSTVPKKPQKITEWARPFGFLIPIMLQSIKKIDGEPLETLKNFRKKSHEAETAQKCTCGTLY